MANKLDYDIKGLRDGIEKCKKNIDVFNKAIQGEHATIDEYRRYIEIIEHRKDNPREEIIVSADANY